MKKFYAAGDCAASGNPALPRVAGYKGAVAVANILYPSTRTLEPMTIPSVVFSLPAMARAGLGEEQAHGQEHNFEAHTANSSSWYSSLRVAEECSGSKVLIELAI
jgi:glutathione reductase (NADPH)